MMINELEEGRPRLLEMKVKPHDQAFETYLAQCIIHMGRTFDAMQRLSSRSKQFQLPDTDLVSNNECSDS
jgi:hypothetical protein